MITACYQPSLTASDLDGAYRASQPERGSDGSLTGHRSACGRERWGVVGAVHRRLAPETAPLAGIESAEGGVQGATPVALRYETERQPAR